MALDRCALPQSELTDANGKQNCWTLILEIWIYGFQTPISHALRAKLGLGFSLRWFTRQTRRL